MFISIDRDVYQTFLLLVATHCVYKNKFDSGHCMHAYHVCDNYSAGTQLNSYLQFQYQQVPTRVNNKFCLIELIWCQHWSLLAENYCHDMIDLI